MALLNRRLWALMLLAVCLSGCGNKGPLHLPQTPSADAGETDDRNQKRDSRAR